jgi:outer membrane protein
MKKIIPNILLLLVAGIQGLSAQNSYSIQQCLDYALQNNIYIKNSLLDGRITDSKARELHTKLLPQVDGNLDYLHNFNVQKIILENGVIPAFSSPSLPNGAVEAFQLQLNNVLTGSISASQVIFDRSLFAGLRNEANIKLLSSQQIRYSKIDVAEKVIKAYYGVLVAQKQYDFLGKNLSRVDTLYLETKARFNNGIARQIDLDRIEVRFNNLKEEQEKAKQIVDLSFAVLRFQMNLPLSEPLQLSDKLNENTILESLTTSGDYDYSHRIEFAMLQTQQQIELANKEVIKSSYAPKLNAYGTTGYNPAATHLGDIFQGSRYFNYTYIGVRLNVPIFHGFARNRQAETESLQLQKIDNSIQQVKSQINLDVQQAQINLSNNVESLKTQKRNLKLAEENVRVIRIENEKGIATNVEVTNAEADLKEAQTNYYNTLYQALLAKTDLDKAKGILLD